MTIVRVGSNPKLADGWETAFGGKKSAGKKAESATEKPAAKKAVSKKAAPAKKGKK